MSAPRTSCTELTLITVAAVILQFIGLTVFLFAFFPVKPTLPGHSDLESLRPPSCTAGGAANRSETSLPPDRLRSLYQEVSEFPPPYERLILMVIDSLPAEFVLGKNGKPPRKAFMEAMPYTQSLLANGMAVGYHAVAAAPTVTMPRLKAMVSGAIGGFLDVAFNFNTQAYLDDNLVAQFFKIGWKMVKDTVQVDQNVSRHLDEELSTDDWNILVWIMLDISAGAAVC
ncbi:hypothetical protein PIB30_012170 [Stylosanthes scabra]|uniref:Uncharacterized protein n=1 Tax=Stylosanthes scabra TaxID=79078 RepID=A0ABU6T5T2_9FABA|nr:hypothetical protein [Stylosanthes scabra]